LLAVEAFENTSFRPADSKSFVSYWRPVTWESIAMQQAVKIEILNCSYWPNQIKIYNMLDTSQVGGLLFIMKRRRDKK